MEEEPIGTFCLSDETAWTLGASNIGVFIGGTDQLEMVVEKLMRLESPGVPQNWIIIPSTVHMATVITDMWMPPKKRVATVTRLKVPRARNNVILATPELLKRITGGTDLRIAGLILIDMLCHVHKARNMPMVRGFRVQNDRPQLIANFRNSLCINGWTPPLLIISEQRAKWVHTDYIARAYCLDAFWFVDGETFVVK